MNSIALPTSDYDSSSFDSNINVGKQLLSTDPKSALGYFQKALIISESEKNISKEALSYKQIGIAYFFYGDYVKSIQSYEKSMGLFSKINDSTGIANMLTNIGNIYFNQGDDTKALEYYFKSLEIAERIKDTLRIATNYTNIGTTYQKKKHTLNLAIKYLNDALLYSELIGDNDNISANSNNLGEIHFNEDNDSLALVYFEKARRVDIGTEHEPYTLINIGNVFRKRSDFLKAAETHINAYNVAMKINSKLYIGKSLIELGKTYFQNGNYKGALDAFIKSESICIETGDKYGLNDIYQGLSETQYKLKNYPEAYIYSQKLLDIKKSIYDGEVDKRLSDFMFNSEMNKKKSEIQILTKDQQLKQQEIKRQKVVRNGFIGGFAIVLLFAGVFLSQRNRISKEKKRSDELLLNILPEETAEELKATGSAKAKSFDSISVLFTDFKNFTQASEILSAEELVEEINQCYSEFDRIITKHGLEKIKTIGDSYMCAGGIPVTCEDHAERMVRAGLEMQAFIEDNKQKRMQANLPYFELRLGIHSGPVVAGVVGTKKFAYDIWGDTVNTASRMESSGAIGKVNISEATYELVKDKFKCVSRGKVAAKNKGEIEMYFVEGALA